MATAGAIDLHDNLIGENSLSLLEEEAPMANELFPVPEDVASAAHVDRAAYDEMYRRSVEDPEGFWGEHGKRIDWFTPYTLSLIHI